MKSKYPVTVAVVTYRPDKQKLLSTLRSVLRQKNTEYQIVLADDGSDDPLMEEAQELFRQFDFEDYKLVQNPQNRGTVYNVLSAAAAADGAYIKPISPGDMLADEHTLEKWVAHIESAKAKVSCSAAVCYTASGNTAQPVAHPAFPQNTRCYLQNDREKARYQFLVLDDIFLGAATLCHTQTLLTYLQEIAGKIVYGEDNVYRLMAYDRIPMSYFDEVAVVYEVGTGVSTSKSQIWNQRLQKDWDACKQMIFSRPAGAGDATAVNFRIKHSGDPSDRRKLFRVKGLLAWKLRCKLFTRTTDCALPDGFRENVMYLKG